MSEQKLPDIRNDPIYREVLIHLNRMILQVELRLQQIERTLNITSANELEFIRTDLIEHNIDNPSDEQIEEANLTWDRLTETKQQKKYREQQ